VPPYFHLPFAIYFVFFFFFFFIEPASAIFLLPSSRLFFFFFCLYAINLLNELSLKCLFLSHIFQDILSLTLLSPLIERFSLSLIFFFFGAKEYFRRFLHAMRMAAMQRGDARSFAAP